MILTKLLSWLKPDTGEKDSKGVIFEGAWEPYRFPGIKILGMSGEYMWLL